jgi:aminoglycoside phosphotransferase family enzyme
MRKQTREMLEFLKRKEAYDEPVKEIRLIQTHISWVFLTGNFVYKIKKPVDFGFLDFTMLDKRKRFCQREVEINRMFSPEIYLGVLPVNRFGNSIKVNGPGETIDYAVKMKQLPQELLMDRLLDKNQVETKDIERIVDVLVKFYSETQTFRDPHAIGSLETVRFNWNENFKQTREFIGKTIEKRMFEEIKDKVENFMDRNKDLFEKRLKEGFVKWCHGDLHSGNIFIIDQKVYVFDAIEFNERFAISDVASDIAFLSMDLEFRKRKYLSEYLIRKYVEDTGDIDFEKLLDFYRCYRAYVRGKVTSFRINDPSLLDFEKKDAEGQAKIYFQLANEYARNL